MLGSDSDEGDRGGPGEVDGEVASDDVPCVQEELLDGDKVSTVGSSFVISLFRASRAFSK